MGKPKVHIDKDLFIHMYVDQKKNGLEMAVLFGIGRTTVSRYLKRWGIQERNISEVRKNKFWKGSEEQYKNSAILNSQKLGDKNPNYKGGYVDKYGYRLIYNNGKKYKEHRYVVEKYLNRKLHYCEDIHHINGNKLDNRIENLQVLSKEEHSQLHWSRLERRELQSEKIIKRRAENNWSTRKKTT